jgi:hypothetical protein
VFALKLNGGDFPKKSADLIRRKFFIDADRSSRRRAVHHFETIPSGRVETCRSPSALIGCGIVHRKRRGSAVFGCNAAGLSVHLMSL